MKHIILALSVFAIISGCGNSQDQQEQTQVQEHQMQEQADAPEEAARPRVIVSPRDPHYFELDNGAPYIPIGLNILHPIDWSSTDAGMAQLDEWFGKLEENGANFVRVWLSSAFFEVEHGAVGEYDEERAHRIDRLFEIAKKHNIRLKLTLEHFRSLEGSSWSSKPIYNVANGGFAENMADFFTNQASREHFLSKLDWYRDRYGDDPIVFGWELWNEMNAVRGGDWMAWTRDMLPEMHARFPGALVMQSLGSLDRAAAFPSYQEYVHIPTNDVAQVHRYLDPGARLDVCRGPMDILAADAVTQILSYDPGKPVLLAESGAVQANHAGPSDLYALDKIGLILHDVLFAPFFAGAAGTGHSWHWDSYVAENDLWWHFGRFAEAVRGLDPPAEHFDPVRIGHEYLRIYGLKGETTFTAWIRDGGDTWEHELANNRVPEIIRGAEIDLSEAGVEIGDSQVLAYDPWSNIWREAITEGNVVYLPTFSRSTVIRVTY